ncbi:hypothetical protein ACKVE0_09235 [Acinetobacter albensis]|uniref:Uncharacterized protein n=1 Tax=Acinetobacter albensis TaxID=1673609 RepID=A0ABW9JVA1_9GAMM
MNILNGTEAFAAMTSGQKIECRVIESDHDFGDIRNFPATVLIDAGYEFRIAVVYMTIGEMQVPESIKDAPAKGIQCFLPSVLTEVLSKAFKWKNSDSDLALMQRGQVHLVQQHAEIHAQALIKVSGGSLENVQNSTSDDVVEKTFDSQSNIQITEQGPVTVVEDSLIVEPIETDAVKLVEKFTADINAAETVDAALTEDPVQLSQSMKMEYMVALTGATQLDAIAGLENEVNKDSRLLDNHKGILNTYIKTRRRVINEASKPTEIAEPIHEHPEHLKEILADIALAKTPVEVNAQIKYTKSWSEGQRKPVIMAMNARLIELSQLNIEVTETPSLMVQIQNAPDLTALDVLEIDVGSRHPGIQPKLMSCVTKRRFELENGINPLEASV